MVKAVLILLGVSLTLLAGWLAGFAKGSETTRRELEKQREELKEEEPGDAVPEAPAAPAVSAYEWHIGDSFLPRSGRWVLVCVRHDNSTRRQVRFARRDIQGEWSCSNLGEVEAWTEAPKVPKIKKDEDNG